MNAPRQGIPLLAKENKACIHIPLVEVCEELSAQSGHQQRNPFHLPILLRLVHFLPPSLFPTPYIMKEKKSVGAKMEYVFILQK